MPRLLDPSASIDVVLHSDADKPEAQRPVFHVRVLSKRDWLEFGRRYDETFTTAPLAESGTEDTEDVEAAKEARRVANEERVEERYRLAKWVLRGWKNMRSADDEVLVFAETSMDEVLDPWELIELLDAALTGGRLSYEQKKT